MKKIDWPQNVVIVLLQGLVHTTWDKFENRAFTLKTHHMSILSTLRRSRLLIRRFRGADRETCHTSANFALVYHVSLSAPLIRLLCSWATSEKIKNATITVHRRKAPFSKCFLSTLKRKAGI